MKYFLIGVLALSLQSVASAIDLIYAPSPADNPMKGLVPYVDADGRDHFPCSLEFRYFAFSDLMTGPEQFDWSKIEKTLQQTSSRGNQLILRIYLEMPGKKKGVPPFLVSNGLEITKWKSDDGMCYTPDYQNESLREAMRHFITAFGEKYDGDPRIGYITCGILGMWGEWHDYPREELFASKEVQNEIYDAYAKAFTKTHVLHRYPAGRDDYHYAPNDTRPMGYHDDSFAWATLDTGRDDDSWFYMALLKKAGHNALSKWKTHPIGGEIRPELWKAHFTDKPHKRQQDFTKCVQETHVTWLMDSGLFGRSKPSAVRVDRAKTEVSKMGYELHLSSAELGNSSVTFTVENRGVAPFYQDWPVELSYLAPTIKTRTIRPDWYLSEVYPGETVKWTAKIAPVDNLQVQLRVIHPMKGGKPFRFANVEMNGDALSVDF